MTLEQLNKSTLPEAKEALFRCCGSTRWVDLMGEKIPYENEEALQEWGRHCWYEKCGPKDWKEAFTHHPKIGDISELAKKFATTKSWAGEEQAGVQQAGKETLEALSNGNRMYEEKYGYIFIVCATGKSASEMLKLLLHRLRNDSATELKIAMAEQYKITILRLQKLLLP